MLKVIATDVIISKGYDNAPALKFSNGGDREMVRFRFGKKVYDRNAKDNTRWVNMTVKAFGDLCERVKKMQLKEGAVVNLIGRLDEDSWTDETTGEKKSLIVIILDEIEYASVGGSKKDNNNQSAQNVPGAPSPQSYSNQGMGFVPAQPPYPNMGGTPAPQYNPNQSSGNATAPAPAPQPAMQPTQGNQGMPQNFTGFEAFGGGSYFDAN